MRLAEILPLERVTVELAASSKPAALQALAGLFRDLDAGAVERVFLERESLASTGVGSGVAIPHGRMAGLGELRAALAVSHGGIDFDAIDGRPVHIFVAVLAPESRGTGDHLKLLARLSRALRRAAVRERLFAAESAEAARDALLEAEASP